MHVSLAEILLAIIAATLIIAAVPSCGVSLA